MSHNVTDVTDAKDVTNVIEAADSSDISPLSPKQLSAAYYLAEGESMSQIARCLKLSRQTIYRWSNLPEFREEVEILRQEIQEKSSASREQFFDSIITKLHSSLNGLGSTETALALFKLIGPGRLFGEPPLHDASDVKKP